jgi:hypothetical protein
MTHLGAPPRAIDLQHHSFNTSDAIRVITMVFAGGNSLQISRSIDGIKDGEFKLLKLTVFADSMDSDGLYRQTKTAYPDGRKALEKSFVIGEAVCSESEPARRKSRVSFARFSGTSPIVRPGATSGGW